MGGGVGWRHGTKWRGLTGCGTLSVQVKVADQTNTERAVTWQSSQGPPTRNSIAFW